MKIRGKPISRVPGAAFSRLLGPIKIARKRNKHLRSEKRNRSGRREIDTSLLRLDALNFQKIDRSIAQFLTKLYLDHQFDLLGSGWTKVDYTLVARGLEGFQFDMRLPLGSPDQEGEWLKHLLNPPHLNYSQSVWGLISPAYSPIDWQVDFKSGFRWDTQKSSWDQRALTKPGADIKVPWELSRLQHLPRLAIFALILPEYRQRIVQEFRDQTLDFIACNPPGMGVNWACSMDVGIRAANLLLAYDLLTQMDEAGDEVLDTGFKRIFADSIYNHGRHIVENLEWSAGNSKNHYLANIAGLLWIAAYLPSSDLTDAWLVFAVQELIEETCRQFHEDGSNFESSTSYHRLVGEMVAYSTALVFGVLRTDRRKAFSDYRVSMVRRLKRKSDQRFSLDSSDFFPQDYLQRLVAMGRFTLDLTKPDNHICQIGDNDSGRFFKLSPCGELLSTGAAITRYINLEGYKSRASSYWDEDDLDHRSFIAAVGGIVPDPSFERARGAFPLEHGLIQTLSGGHNLILVPRKSSAPPKIPGTQPAYPLKSITRSHETKISFADYGLLEVRNVRCCFYRQFGVCVFRTNGMMLVVMVGNNKEPVGHAHNDCGSFQLFLNDRDVFIDRGTYLYTPIPARRNEFRSVYSHNVPVVDGREQNEFLGPFRVRKIFNCNLISLSERGVELELKNESLYHRRKITLDSKGIGILDESNSDFTVNLVAPESHTFSPGYGKLCYRCSRSPL